MWKACEDHVKDMWKFHLLFHMGMCEKQCEITMWKPSEMGWSFSHHAWCEKTMWNRKFTSCIVRLGLMIWCEKLCETCEKTMWNKKIHIMHCKTRLNDMMWKTMWNLFWLTCKHVKFQFHILFHFILIISDPVYVPGRTYHIYIYICMQIMRMPMIYMQPIASCSWPDHDRSCD